jgi:dihydrofolate reductase
MGRVIVHFSISLDGFIAGPDAGIEYPLGKGGERLHQWMFNQNPDAAESTVHPVDADISQRAFAAVGAVVLGRRTFDGGVGIWGDTPYPVPSFVLTHEVRDALPMTSASFTFVNDGIESAVLQAKQAAGAKDVTVMGADTAQQVLRAGLGDELHLELIPVLLGAGTRLFDHIGTEQIELTRTMLIETPAVTHIRFRVEK